jgi:hypothetical protein
MNLYYFIKKDIKVDKKDYFSFFILTSYEKFVIILFNKKLLKEMNYVKSYKKYKKNR